MSHNYYPVLTPHPFCCVPASHQVDLLHIDTETTPCGDHSMSQLSPLEDINSNAMTQSATLSMSPPPELLASTSDPFCEGTGDFPDHMGVAPQAEAEADLDLDPDDHTNDASMNEEEGDVGIKMRAEHKAVEEESQESVEGPQTNCQVVQHDGFAGLTGYQ